MSHPLDAAAAPWSVPINVRVVQKSNVDTNGRVYGSIQQAINSITNASATTPYLVKIMPGVYNENVTMTPFVSLVGSGQDVTRIAAPTGTTVSGADGAEISELSIIGNGGTSAILNYNASPRIRNVTISVSGSSSPGYPTMGIYNYATQGIADVRIDNVKISMVIGGGGAFGVANYGPVASIVRNSSIAITAQDTIGASVAGVNGNNDGTVALDASDVAITVSDPTGNGYAAGVYEQFASISNSKISVTAGCPWAAGVVTFGGSDVVTRIHNTLIEAPTSIIPNGARVMCANAYDTNLAPACP